MFNEDSEDLNSLIQFEKFSIPVKAITLMASKEENGKFNGVPIYKVNLKNTTTCK
jgi:2'-5' RNA ligase